MILLASNSPRRRQLMALGGWDFTVRPVEVDESHYPGEAPAEYVQRLARSKAVAAAPQIPEAVVVAADTTVAAVPEDSLDGREEILGKPASPAEAETMLRRLRGRTHWVYTGLAVWRAAGAQLLEDVCETRVTMRNYEDEELQVYIATGDPLDKAGAYAIQHPEFNPVASLAGCYANVVGLPLCALTRLLARAGVASPVDADLAVACQSELQTQCPFYPLTPRLDTSSTEP